MPETVERSFDFSVYVPVTRRELIPEQMKDRKIDLISSMAIRGVDFRLNFRSVVEQNVEDIMAFMFVCAYDPGVNRDVVGNECIGHNALFQAEVFGRMAGIDRRAFNRLLPTNTGPCGLFFTGNKSIKCVNWKFIFAENPAMGIV